MAGSLAPLPKSRAEAILQNVLGDDNELETSKSRIEDLLKQLIGQSGGGGAFVITLDTNTGNLDKTPNEILAAINAGQVCVIVKTYDGGQNTYLQYVVYIGEVDGRPRMSAMNPDGNQRYDAQDWDSPMYEYFI